MHRFNIIFQTGQIFPTDGFTKWFGIEPGIGSGYKTYTKVSLLVDKAIFRSQNTLPSPCITKLKAMIKIPMKMILIIIFSIQFNYLIFYLLSSKVN